MFYPFRFISRRIALVISTPCLLPIILSSTGCATRPTQASAPPPTPAAVAPDAEDKAMEAKAAYYMRMQKKVEAQANKRYNQEAAQNAQAEKKGVLVSGSGYVIHSEQSVSGQSDYAENLSKGTSDQIAAGKRYGDAVNDAEAANSFLESRDEAGIELGAHMFGEIELGVMREYISRMNSDLDAMQQSFSAMSPSAQASADPSSTGLSSGPISGISAKDLIQQDIVKWQTAIDTNRR